MAGQRLPILARMLVAFVVGLGSTLPCAGHGGGGHGGGGGHALGGGGGGSHGGGFNGGFGRGRFFGYPGYYGYPGFFGFGMGLGLGYGLGYGYGYPYYPYPAGYPVYVSPGYGPPPAPSVCPVAGPAPVAPPGPAPGTPFRITDADMLLSIRVPPDAVVRINGAKTNQSGPRREFLSSGLAPGRTYTFVVTAQWTGSNGQAVDLEQRVHVQGGERRNVDFLTLSPPPQDFPQIERASGNQDAH